MTAPEDRAALAAAYEQAIFAAGNSDPNPAVGAVITNPAGNIIATGYTQRAGYAHAERHALAQLPQHDLSNHTLYVTLEPCCHHGRTPPCTDAILEHKIRRVVIAERDFASEVQGRSVALLRQNGIEVTEWSTHDFRAEKWYTTGPFFFSRKHQRPRVLLKWAQTADGSLAPVSGTSGPVSGRDAGFLTAALRFWCKLTVAAPGTVLLDAPRLSVRATEELPDFSATGLSAFAWELLRIQYRLAGVQHDADTLTRTVRPPEQLRLLPEARAASDHNQPALSLWPAAGLEENEPNAASEGRKNLLQGRLWSLDSRSEPRFAGAGLPPGEKVLPAPGGSKRDRGAFPEAAQIIPRERWRHDFAATFASVLSAIRARGFNSLLLEAGPAFSDQVIAHGYADAVAVYRSRDRNDRALWGKPGRSNSLSRRLAAAEKPELSGYTLLEYARLSGDDFLLYVRTDTL